MNSQGCRVVPATGELLPLPPPPAQGGWCLLVQMFNSAAGLGAGSDPGKGREGKGTSPEAWWWWFVPMCKGWNLPVQMAVGTLGDDCWYHPGRSEASGSVQGIKGPQNASRGPRAGGSPLVVLRSQRPMRQVAGDTVVVASPSALPPPGHKHLSRVIGFSGQSRPQMCLLGWGDPAAWGPGGHRHRAAGDGVSVSPCPHTGLSPAVVGRHSSIFCSCRKCNTMQKEEMVIRCHQVFGQHHGDGTVCSCPPARSLGAQVCVCTVATCAAFCAFVCMRVVSQAEPDTL